MSPTLEALGGLYNFRVSGHAASPHPQSKQQPEQSATRPASPRPLRLSNKRSSTTSTALDAVEYRARLTHEDPTGFFALLGRSGQSARARRLAAPAVTASFDQEGARTPRAVRCQKAEGPVRGAGNPDHSHWTKASDGEGGRLSKLRLATDGWLQDQSSCERA